jgi:hypothetical protein
MAAYVAGDVILNALTLRQIRDSTLNAGAEVITAVGSTGIDPSALFAGMIDPQATFVTEDIASLLAAVDIQSGLGIASSNAITIPFRGRSNLAQFVGSGASFAVTSSSGGLVVIESIDAQMNQRVTATVRVYYLGNGGEDPFGTPTSTHTYASEAFVSNFDMGPAALTSSGPTTTSPDIIGWTVNPGITVESQREVSTSNSGRAPAKLFITSRNPTIDLRFRSVNNLTTLTATIKALTGVTVYARKRSDLGSFVSDATSEHLSFTFGDALSSVQTLSGSGRQPGEVSLRITGKSLAASYAAALSS